LEAKCLPLAGFLALHKLLEHVSHFFHLAVHLPHLLMQFDDGSLQVLPARLIRTMRLLPLPLGTRTVWMMFSRGPLFAVSEFTSQPLGLPHQLLGLIVHAGGAEIIRSDPQVMQTPFQFPERAAFRPMSLGPGSFSVTDPLANLTHLSFDRLELLLEVRQRSLQFAHGSFVALASRMFELLGQLPAVLHQFLAFPCHVVQHFLGMRTTFAFAFTLSFALAMQPLTQCAFNLLHFMMDSLEFFLDVPCSFVGVVRQFFQFSLQFTSVMSQLFHFLPQLVDHSFRILLFPLLTFLVVSLSLVSLPCLVALPFAFPFVPLAVATFLSFFLAIVSFPFAVTTFFPFALFTIPFATSFALAFTLLAIALTAGLPLTLLAFVVEQGNLYTVESFVSNLRLVGRRISGERSHDNGQRRRRQGSGPSHLQLHHR
jgi:hypothetical protein